MSADTTQTDTGAPNSLLEIAQLEPNKREALTREQILAACPPKLKDIGGGDAYDPAEHSPTGSERVTRDDADYVVSQVDELKQAAGSLSKGETLFLEPNRYEFGDDVAKSLVIEQENVTIASDRGVDGSEGALLRHTGTYGGTHTIHLKAAGARVTGLRIRRNEVNTWATRDEFENAGEPYGNFEKFRMDEKMKEQGVPEDERTSRLESGKAIYKIGATDGVVVEGADCEIDNCEIRGCVHSGIQVRRGEGDWNIENNTRIHHNTLTDHAAPTLGYCIVVKSGHPVIERNYTNNARHHITGDGDRDCGYDLRENILGPESNMHVVDMHEGGTDDNGNVCGGHFCEITQNVLLSEQTGIKWRATPWDSHTVSIEGNWLVNPSQTGGAGSQGDGIFQMHRRGNVGLLQMKTKNNSHGPKTPNEKTGPEGLFETEPAQTPGDPAQGDTPADETPPRDRPPEEDDIFAVLERLFSVLGDHANSSK